MKLFLLEVMKFEKHLLPIIAYEIHKSSISRQNEKSYRFTWY